MSCTSTTAKQYFLTGATKAITPVGIALDGHLIYGPYKDGSSTWGGCDVDVCNGRQINGAYSYVMSTFHPYTIGCWGPGSAPNSFCGSCSANPRQCLAP